MKFAPPQGPWKSILSDKKNKTRSEIKNDNFAFS